MKVRTYRYFAFSYCCSCYRGRVCSWWINSLCSATASATHRNEYYFIVIFIANALSLRFTIIILIIIYINTIRKSAFKFWLTKSGRKFFNFILKMKKVKKISTIPSSFGAKSLRSQYWFSLIWGWSLILLRRSGPNLSWHRNFKVLRLFDHCCMWLVLAQRMSIHKECQYILQYQPGFSDVNKQTWPEN